MVFLKKHTGLPKDEAGKWRLCPIYRSPRFKFKGLENESYELYISVGSDHRGGMEFGVEMETDIEFYDPDDPESSMVTGPEFSVGVQSVMEVFSLPTIKSSDDEPILFARDKDWHVLSVFSRRFDNSNGFEAKISGVKFDDIEDLWKDKDDRARVVLTLSLYYITDAEGSEWKAVDSGSEFKKKRKRRAPFLDRLIRKEKTDVTIECGGREFAVHKLVLSCVSPVFDRMLETDMSEKETGVIKIQDVTPETVQLMLEFIYTGRLFSKNGTTKDKPEDQVLIQLLDCAEKYGIDELKDQVGQEICGNLTVMNAVTFLNALKLYKMDEKIGGKVMEFCKKNLSAFPKDETFKKFLMENMEALI